MYNAEHWHIAYRLPKGRLKLGRRFSTAERASKAADKERPDRICVSCNTPLTSLVVVGCNFDPERSYFVDSFYKAINPCKGG